MADVGAGDSSDPRFPAGMPTGLIRAIRFEDRDTGQEYVLVDGGEFNGWLLYWDESEGTWKPHRRIRPDEAAAMRLMPSMN